MTGIEYNLKDILSEYFGERGVFLLVGELKTLGASSLEELNTGQKQTLADAIMDDLFAKILTDRHFAMVQHKVYKALGVSDDSSDMADVVD